MSWKDRFVLGTKIIGVDCLTRAIYELFYSLPWQLEQVEQFGRTDGIFKVSVLIMFTIPAVMTVLGFYLIRDGKRVHESTLRGFDEFAANTNAWLNLGIVLYGAYLVISSVPETLHILANLVVVLQAPVYVDTEAWRDRVLLDVPSTICTVVLGLVCVRKEKISHAQPCVKNCFARLEVASESTTAVRIGKQAHRSLLHCHIIPERCEWGFRNPRFERDRREDGGVV